MERHRDRGEPFSGAGSMDETCGEDHALEELIATISRYMADAGVTEDDRALIREAAAIIARFVGTPPGSGSTVSAAGALPKAWLTPEEEALVPPRRLWLGPSDPISHYYRWAWEYLAYLTLLCDLHRESAVLELGCGHGRTARGLLGYLKHPGHYCGLDVDLERIKDAQTRLQATHSHFQFRWADVHNRQYNPQGCVPADSYVLPFPDEAFDVIYAASLFTHLLPGETANYLSQSRRVLKPRGKCLFSMFVLDYYRGPGTTISPNYEFPHSYPGHPGVAVRDPLHPDVVIAYDMATIERLAEGGGLKVLRVVPGLWSESPGLAVNEQDLVLLCRDE